MRNAFRARGAAHLQTPLAVLELQPRAKRAADGVTEAVCALGRAELHTKQGSLLLEKLPQGASAIELMVDILPGRIPRIAQSLRAVDVLQQAYGRLPSKSHARPGVQGGCATQRLNHEGAVAVPLRQGARDRPAGGARIAAEAGSSCFLWTGQPDPRDRTL